MRGEEPMPGFLRHFARRHDARCLLRYRRHRRAVIKIAALVDTVAPSAAGIPAALIEIKAVWYAVTPCLAPIIAGKRPRNSAFPAIRE
jgi:hypothetical protein